MSLELLSESRCRDLISEYGGFELEGTFASYIEQIPTGLDVPMDIAFSDLSTGTEDSTNGIVTYNHATKELTANADGYIMAKSVQRARRVGASNGVSMLRLTALASPVGAGGLFFQLGLARDISLADTDVTERFFDMSPVKLSKGDKFKFSLIRSANNNSDPDISKHESYTNYGNLIPEYPSVARAAAGDLPSPSSSIQIYVMGDISRYRI